MVGWFNQDSKESACAFQTGTPERAAPIKAVAAIPAKFGKLVTFFDIFSPKFVLFSDDFVLGLPMIGLEADSQGVIEHSSRYRTEPFQGSVFPEFRAGPTVETLLSCGTRKLQKIDYLFDIFWPPVGFWHRIIDSAVML
jgi:hypothetical protein